MKIRQGCRPERKFLTGSRLANTRVVSAGQSAFPDLSPRLHFPRDADVHVAAAAARLPMPAFLPPPAGLHRRRAAFPSRSAARPRPALAMSARALLAVAPGSEEIETATTLSVLARAGVAVTVASAAASAAPVTLSRGMVLAPDAALPDLPPADAFDLLVLPGGAPGAAALAACGPLEARVRAALAGGAEGEAKAPVVGAICAAPGVCLGGWGLVEGRKVTGYPAPAFVEQCGEGYVDGEDVVVDGRLVTSRGPATAMAFALALVGAVLGEEARAKVAKEVLFE